MRYVPFLFAPHASSNSRHWGTDMGGDTVCRRPYRFSFLTGDARRDSFQRDLPLCCQAPLIKGSADVRKHQKVATTFHKQLPAPIAFIAYALSLISADPTLIKSMSSSSIASLSSIAPSGVSSPSATSSRSSSSSIDPRWGTDRVMVLDGIFQLVRTPLQFTMGHWHEESIQEPLPYSMQDSASNSDQDSSLNSPHGSVQGSLQGSMHDSVRSASLGDSGYGSDLDREQRRR
jgi:hypothetical protein